MCGAAIEEGDDGCQKLFEDVLALEYSNPVCGRTHLITVDCYALQHSEVRRAQSSAFHLLRLGWILMRDGNPQIGKTDLDFKRYVGDLRHFPHLEAPENRGSVTIVDLVLAKNAEEHGKTALVWAKSVWNAWEIHHAWALKILGV